MNIEEFASSDGGHGIVVDDELIFRAECSDPAWSSTEPLDGIIVVRPVN